MDNKAMIEKERNELAALKEKGLLTRLKWYFSKSGPGWMQSAMTLGGGSAMASLFAGAFLKYQLLWVQPVSMLMGIIMLSALSYQTLTRGERPFYAMKKYLSPTIAWMWAIFTLVTTMIWHFPQYALVSGMSLDLLQLFFSFELKESSTQQTVVLLIIALAVFALAATIVWNYGKDRKGVKLLENIIKGMVWFIIFCFAGVVITRSFTSDGIRWNEVLSGFMPFSFTNGFHWNIPSDTTGITIFIASLSLAVGLNMTFLFGYSFLKKGWTKEYTGLANFDLITGMLFPYTLATSLMIIAAGSTLHTQEFLDSNVTNISPIAASGMLEAAGLPSVVARLIFGLAIIGMALNAIIIHMVVSGFAVCEIFSIEPTGRKYRLATLIPFPGILGAVLWSKLGTWIAIPTSAVALIMLPVGYIGFFLLNNSHAYLQEDMPRGKKRFIWNAAMIVTITITLMGVAFYIVKVLPTYF